MAKRLKIIVPKETGDESIEFEPETISVNQYMMIAQDHDNEIPMIVHKKGVGEPILFIAGNMPDPLKNEIDKLIKKYCNH